MALQAPHPGALGRGLQGHTTERGIIDIMFHSTPKTTHNQPLRDPFFACCWYYSRPNCFFSYLWVTL